MWNQFFTFFNTGRYDFYDILSFARGRRCSGLSDTAFYTTPTQSSHGDNATALEQFAQNTIQYNTIHYNTIQINF